MIRRRTSPVSTLVVAAAVVTALLTLASAAFASVTITSAFREVVTFASLMVDGDPQGQSDVDQLTSDALGLFEETVVSDLEDDGTFIHSNASQTSQIGPAHLSLVGEFDSHAGLGATGVFAEGFGVSHAIIHFEMNSQSTVHFIGTMSAGGNGSTGLLLDDDGSTTFLALGGTNGTFPVDESISIGPGAFILRVSSGGYGRQFEGQAPSPASGSFSIDVSFGESTSASATSLLGSADIVLLPNPIREATVIQLGPRVPPGASVFVVDTSGRRVRDLGPVLSRSITWDARDDHGSRLAAGVYFVRVGDAASARATIVR